MKTSQGLLTQLLGEPQSDRTGSIRNGARSQGTVEQSGSKGASENACSKKGSKQESNPYRGEATESAGLGLVTHWHPVVEDSLHCRVLNFLL